MNFEEIINMEADIDKIIELSEANKFSNKNSDLNNKRKNEEFYGSPQKSFTTNNPNFKKNFNPKRNLLTHLESLSLEKLKAIRSLIILGEIITNENIEDADIEYFKNKYSKIYSSQPDNKNKIIDYLLENTSDISNYLTTGLMYCS